MESPPPRLDGDDAATRGDREGGRGAEGGGKRGAREGWERAGGEEGRQEGGAGTVGDRQQQSRGRQRKRRRRTDRMSSWQNTDSPEQCNPR